MAYLNDLVFTTTDDSTICTISPCTLYVNPVGMPKIDKLFYNGTHTTVKWSDGTRTTVNAAGDDKFNKEVGLAMCIARKYFEDNGRCDTPRAEFLKTVENANPPAPKVDQKKKPSYELVRFDPKNNTPFFGTFESIKKAIEDFNGSVNFELLVNEENE